jgi:hypothetical protein
MPGIAVDLTRVEPSPGSHVNVHSRVPALNGEAVPMPLLDPQVTATLGTLQSLDDAIAFRQSRLNLPCPDCTADDKCIDHACDLDLIAGYQDRYAAAYRAALAGMDPDDIEQIMPPGDGTPPIVGVLSAVVLTRLRGLAADGPVMTQLDGRPVMIELDGHAIVEHQLVTDNDDEAGS